jgi:hypothetical protein
MSASPNLAGRIELRIARAARGGWKCVECGKDGHAGQAAVFIGSKCGETKGRLLCGNCAGALSGKLGSSIMVLLKALALSPDTRNRQ